MAGRIAVRRGPLASPPRGVAALPASAPVNTALPVVSGQAVSGQTLTATAGSWTGSPAPTFAYGWQDCGAAGAARVAAAGRGGSAGERAGEHGTAGGVGSGGVGSDVDGDGGIVDGFAGADVRVWLAGLRCGGGRSRRRRGAWRLCRRARR